MHEFAVIIFGDWEIVDRLGTKSRTCCNVRALCDPSNTLTYHVRFICVSFRGGNPEERVADGKNETAVQSVRNLSQNGNGLKDANVPYTAEPLPNELLHLGVSTKKVITNKL